MKALLLSLTLTLLAATGAKLPNTPLPSETAFVQSQTKALNAAYPTPADAQKAGYFRYNNEDSTGAISYANLKWNSAADPAHPQPSQLWYDVHGHLLGADYSVPLTDAPPHLWGLDPNRWYRLGHDHLHYIVRKDGSLDYGHAVSAKAFTAAGGNVENPQPQTLVKLGKVASASDDARVFRYPAQWNLEIWVTPNPLGAFADKNPLVHPSKNAGTDEM